MPLLWIQFLILVRRFPALILLMYKFATFKKMATRRRLIAKWLFSKASHLGLAKISFYALTSTTTLSESTSVTNLC